jgi:preprotein translocase subunit SecG
MTFVLDVLQVFISVMLIFLVLMHSGKDAGLSGFGMGGGGGGGGGSSPFGGGSTVERNLNRWTVLFAILFVANTIALIKVG